MEALDEGVPHRGVGVGVHELLCFFEISGFEEWPCKEGEGCAVETQVGVY